MSRIATTLAAVALGASVSLTTPATAVAPVATTDCPVGICAPPPECREFVVPVTEALLDSARRVSRLERRIADKNATIKRLRAELASQR